ncbi:MAG: hypothetical protein LBJ04_04035 [Sphingobacterium sp.]|jgi:hypothetical protein|nr:hypothetical protein [Sphingobacterium sp.]
MKNQERERVSFFAKRGYHDLRKYSICLKEYHKNIDKEIGLETSTPLFLDANVLLRYYEISLAARKKLLTFIESNMKRIVLTYQVQQEFLKNREEVIDNFFKDVTAKIPGNFTSEVLNKIHNFLNQNKVILKDYPDFESDISNAKDNLEKARESIDVKIKTVSNDYKKLKFEDPFLDIINKCIILDGLDQEYLTSIKSEFDDLKKDTKDVSSESISKNRKMIFPGLGDIKKKPENPYGDFIIIHEIMKYMVDNSTNAVFLTFDATKKDWMSASKEAYLHYIENVYYNTGKIINILDADRTLEGVLEVDLYSLIESEFEIEASQLTLPLLNQYCSKHKVLRNFKSSSFLEQHVEELIAAGFGTVEDLDHALNEVEEKFLLFLLKQSSITKLGALRFSLIPYNKSYQKIYLRLQKKWIKPSSKYDSKYIEWLVS